MSILIPKTDTCDIERTMKASEFYSCDNFNMCDIFKKNFVEAFLKRGTMNLVIKNYSEFDDTFHVTKNRLFIHLHKDTIHSLITAFEISKFKVRSHAEFYGKFISYVYQKLFR